MDYGKTVKLNLDKIPDIGHPKDTEKLIKRIRSYHVHHKGKLVWFKE